MYLSAATSLAHLQSPLDLRLQEFVLEQLLSQHLFALLPPPDQVRHDCFRGSVRHVLEHIVVLSSQCARDLVGEALQLGDPDPLVLDASLGDQFLGQLHRVLVVCAD